MKVVRKIIEIDEDLCDGCGNCVPACAEGALEIIDGKARVIADIYCDGLGACLGECPTGALKIIERKAQEFDEEAVEDHLAEKEANDHSPLSSSYNGCPSAGIRIFAPDSEDASRKTGKQDGEGANEEPSALAHWPVQIRLVPPDAPFLKGADLLVLADCAPVAFPTLHRDFLKGKAVMMGCPKFDDVQEYVEKFTQIFRRSQIGRVTIVVMEVPCCSALPAIVKRALNLSGVSLPLEEVIVSTRGKILKKRTERTA
jgi:NAD-dependent dihydropyrimidine dehydrogenase PreA subunit